MEFVFHKPGQSSTRRSESQHTVYRQCRSRADWEVRNGGDSLLKARESREGPWASIQCVTWGVSGLYVHFVTHLIYPVGEDIGTHFSIPAPNKAFMEERA